MKFLKTQDKTETKRFALHFPSIKKLFTRKPKTELKADERIGEKVGEKASGNVNVKVDEKVKEKVSGKADVHTKTEKLKEEEKKNVVVKEDQPKFAKRFTAKLAAKFAKKTETHASTENSAKKSVDASVDTSAGKLAEKFAKRAAEKSIIEKSGKLLKRRPEGSKKDMTPEEKRAHVAESTLRRKLEREAQKRLAHDLRKKRQEEKKRKRSAAARKRNLSDYLSKAGYPEANIEVVRRRVFQISFGITGFLWLIILVFGIVNGKTATDILLFSIGLWTAIFAFLWLFIWGVIYFFLEMRIYRRTKELEEVLPDFLQLTSSNISAGMPIDRALWLAIRPNFGVLAKEIEDVAKATISGEDLGDSLKGLVKRYDSVLLKRSVAILLEGLDAGGELADLLSKIALNIEELKIMKKEMSANVTTYAIFITFASIFIAPVLFALATQLVEIIVSITATLDLSGSTASFIPISPSADRGIIEDFKWYCIMMLSVTAMMSACIIAVIRRGRVREGIRSIPVFLIVALVLYFLANIVLGNVFSGFF